MHQESIWSVHALTRLRYSSSIPCPAQAYNTTCQPDKRSGRPGYQYPAFSATRYAGIGICTGIRSRHECRMETGANDGMPHLTALPKKQTSNLYVRFFLRLPAATAYSWLYYGLFNIVLY
ncbi:hypothetical protein [Paenibacillus xylanexedens]|uniref:hypothetical protein n=1 Tax=Paenibacillus xylanexedens TaxID=528191 RepID=UPI0016438549|nr:hypothetical protein [Paenibacillus xylanexedens]